MMSSLAGKLGDDKGIKAGTFNPQLIVELPAKDTDGVSELHYLGEVIEEQINPDIFKTLGNSEFIAYVVKYNDNSNPKRYFHCQGSKQNSGLTISQNAIGLDTVNAIIPELHPAYLPGATTSIQTNAEVEYNVVDACKSIAETNSLKINAMAPAFEVPRGLTGEIKAGSVIKVQVDNLDDIAAGGTVLGPVSLKGTEDVVIAPLHPLSSDTLKFMMEKCTEFGDILTGSNARGDSGIPVPQVPPPADSAWPASRVIGDLIINREYFHVTYNQTQYIPRRASVNAIIYHEAADATVNSVHYEVDPSGKVYEYLDPKEDQAEHCPGSNSNTIGIKMSLGLKAVLSTSLLTAYLIARFPSIKPNIAPPESPKSAESWARDDTGMLRHKNCQATECGFTLDMRALIPSSEDIRKMAGASSD